MYSPRHGFTQFPFPLLQIAMLRQFDQDAIDATRLPGGDLCRSDVHDDGVSPQPRRVRDEPAHHILPARVVNQQRDVISHLLSQPARYPNRVRVVYVLQTAPVPILLNPLACVIVRLRDEVDPDQRHSLTHLAD